MKPFNFVAIALTLAVSAAVAHADEFMSSAEVEQALAQAGTNPEALGMKKITTCAVQGEPNDSSGPLRQTQRYAATDSAKRNLQAFAQRLQQSDPDWSWSVRCGPSWQLISAPMTQWLGGERGVAAVEWQDPIDTLELVVHGFDRRYVLRGEQVVRYNNCESILFNVDGESRPGIKPGCNNS